MRSLPLLTPSLLLRPFVPGDAEAMRQLNGEPSTRLHLPSHVYETPADAVVALERLVAAYSSPGDPRLGPYVLGVAHRSDGRLLGHVGFSPFRGEVEVSYAISEAERGRGYGSEAVGHACVWASRAFGIERILAITASGNEPSRRMLARAGFMHVADEAMRFQGGPEQPVSRYAWSVSELHGNPGFLREASKIG